MAKWLRKSIGVIVLVGLATALVVGTALAQGEGPQGPEGPEGPQHGRTQQAGRLILQRIAEATGLTTGEVLAELQQGSTPGEILSENGVNPDDFVADVLAELETRLDEAVANGRIDQERANEILEQADERLSELMDRTFDLPGRGRGGDEGRPSDRQHSVARGVLGRLTEATGLSFEEVVAELRDGKTITELLNEHGVDPDAFSAQLLADVEARLDEAVANGQIDQEHADELLARAEERLPELMNRTFDSLGEGQGDGQRPGGPPGQNPGGPPGQQPTPPPGRV